MQAFLLLLTLLLVQCNNTQSTISGENGFSPPLEEQESRIVTGAEQFDAYLPLLEGKRVALVVNHTSLVNDVHLVDTLLSKGIQIKKIFAPEHGFRGTADAGELIATEIDQETGLPLVSLYGSNRKPLPADMKDLDIIIFDIQDVGARFYTYISTMTYAMEASAENGVKFLVLDRPNPNGHYVDGPVLKPRFSSFVGLHQIPVVHGMTVAEYAKMVNGEKWMKNGVQVELHYVPVKNYDHNTFYELPVAPSPNLPNMRSIYLYPSICFFEGTTFSLGRGTNKQFQVIGHPDYPGGTYTFTPVSMPGATHPPQLGKLNRGYDLTELSPEEIRQSARLDLSWIIKTYNNFPDKQKYFIPFFNTLAGTDQLRRQIESGLTEEEIRESWQEDLERFKKIRKKYLLYPDFD